MKMKRMNNFNKFIALVIFLSIFPNASLAEQTKEVSRTTDEIVCQTIEKKKAELVSNIESIKERFEKRKNLIDQKIELNKKNLDFRRSEADDFRESIYLKLRNKSNTDQELVLVDQFKADVESLVNKRRDEIDTVINDFNLEFNSLIEDNEIDFLQSLDLYQSEVSLILEEASQFCDQNNSAFGDKELKRSMKSKLKEVNRKFLEKYFGLKSYEDLEALFKKRNREVSDIVDRYKNKIKQKKESFKVEFAALHQKEESESDENNN
ncbi:MAG: hypothetical protein GF347_05575 [Candidatus Moranbacteria bacterium]|nr:hypothetical protein [Candidatus Moranbacteria bacterium]